MEIPKAAALDVSPDPLDVLVEKRNMSYKDAAEVLGLSLGNEEQPTAAGAEVADNEVAPLEYGQDVLEVAEGLPGYFIEGIPYKVLQAIAEELRESARLSAESKKRGAGRGRSKDLAAQSITLRAQSDLAILPWVRSSDDVPIARIYLRQAFGEKNMPHHHAA